MGGCAASLRDGGSSLGPPARGGIADRGARLHRSSAKLASILLFEGSLEQMADELIPSNLVEKVESLIDMIGQRVRRALSPPIVFCKPKRAERRDGGQSKSGPPRLV